MGSASDLPSALLAQIRDGKVVLVLGAGASIGARHPDAAEIPLGKKLAKLLADEFLGGEHAGDGLAVVSELAISEDSLFHVQEFIRELFEPYGPADFHALLPTFKWHGIATINYDLIIERVYGGKHFQTLRPIKSDADKVEELVRSPDDLLFLKLHGCITNTREKNLPLILTADQYVSHRKRRNQLYEILKGWAYEQTFVFVGTTLEDFDLRQLLVEVEDCAPSRPRFFFVTPSASEPMQRMWESKRVTMLQMTFEQFLKKIDSTIPDLARAVPTAAPSLAMYERFTSDSPTLSEEARLFLEHDVEYIHTGLSSKVVEPEVFYRGAAEGWSPILQNLDCERDLCDEILLDVVLSDSSRSNAQLVPILAPAGAGKTVLLRRLAWEAATQTDSTCLWVKETGILSAEVIEEVIPQLTSRLYLFVDNAPERVGELTRLCDLVERRNLPVTIITCARTNEWNMTCDDLAPFVFIQFELPTLAPREVDGLLALLEKHQALGTLTTETPEARRATFTDYAQGNLLVALHEATLGKPFEEIVLHEYQSVVPQVAQNLYLTICVLNRTGTRIRAGLISRVHGVPFNKFRKQFFAPLEHLVYSAVGKRGYDYEYRSRHPHIAELVFQQVLTRPQERYEKYLSILNALVLSYETDRRSFQQMMNEQSLRDTISDRGLIEQLYAAAKERAPEEGHLYLQHGLFEMKQSNPNFARVSEQFDVALELMPNSDFVKHAMATLELRMADVEARPLLREKHLQRAKALVDPLCGKRARSAHGYHTAFLVELKRLQYLLQDAGAESDEAITTAIQAAERALSDGLQMFPEEITMIAAEAELGDLLDDNERIVEALEQALSKSLHNGSLVGRLARHYERQGRDPEALDLIKRALDVVPYDKKLRYQLAMLLIKQDGDSTLIESHLRKSFTDGDKNHEAQFWYARQLYVNGKIEDARIRFSDLRTTRVSPFALRAPREDWVEKDAPKDFSGTVVRLETNFAFIKRDGAGDDIYTDKSIAPGKWWIAVRFGSRVNFTLAFNFSGPVAKGVELE